MSNQRRLESMVSDVEEAVNLGSFVSYRQSWDYVRRLETVKSKIDGLATKKAAKQCVPLYEMFLSGCYEKADEVDDSSGCFGEFFQELFCSWIEARQNAGYEAEQSVYQMFKWMDNDEYGFLHDVQESLVEVLDREGLALFEARIKSRFREALFKADPTNRKRIYDYPFDVRRNAAILKSICLAKEDTDSYQSLCDELGTTPKDCENIAKIKRKNRQLRSALIWVDKGLDLEKTATWPNESAWGLPALKRNLLVELGRKKDAVESAWSGFEAYPSEFAYDELMKYVSRKDRERWHKKAMKTVLSASLPDIINLSVKTQEWEILRKSVENAGHEELEAISHFTTEKAAEELEKIHPIEAAKIYRAMGMRIVKGKKSRHYDIALDHLRKAKKLYSENKRKDEWLFLVEEVRRDHSRKYSFIGGFERIVSGSYAGRYQSFEERTKKRWEKRLSDAEE